MFVIIIIIAVIIFWVLSINVLSTVFLIIVIIFSHRWNHYYWFSHNFLLVSGSWHWLSHTFAVSEFYWKTRISGFYEEWGILGSYSFHEWGTIYCFSYGLWARCTPIHFSLSLSFSMIQLLRHKSVQKFSCLSWLPFSIFRQLTAPLSLCLFCSTTHGLTSSTSLLSVVSCSAIHGLSLPPSMLSVAYLLHYTWADLISLPDEYTWNAWFCEYDTFRLRMYVFLWQGISDRLCYRTCKTYIDTTVEQLHHPISNKLKLTDVKY